MKRAFDVNAFCSAYAIGRTRAYREMAEGRLKSVKIGSKRIIRVDDAEEWLASLPAPWEAE